MYGKFCRAFSKFGLINQKESNTTLTYTDNRDSFVFVPVVFEMQMMYDLWLASLNHKRQEDEAMLSQPAPEDKYIAMPTDYAEVTVR